jgi:hypothetical protein
VVAGELSCLDSGFELHRILLSSLFWCSAYASPRKFPKRGLTDDGVVVRGELSSLDSGFEFHTILLSSQPPHETLALLR